MLQHYCDVRWDIFILVFVSQVCMCVCYERQMKCEYLLVAISDLLCSKLTICYSYNSWSPSEVT